MDDMIQNGFAFACKHQLWIVDVNASNFALFSHISSMAADDDGMERWL